MVNAQRTLRGDKMKVGDLVRTKHQPWMRDDYDDTEYGFVVRSE